MINVALLGAGGIGEIHARNLCQSGSFALRTIADVDLARAAELCRRFGGVAVDSAATAIGDDEIDAVIIASSTIAHKEHVVLAAEHRKAILCEKPVAASLADAIQCVTAVEQAGLVAQMGFNRRLDPSYQGLRRKIEAGAIGAVEMIRLVSRSDTPPAPESAVQSGGMIREKGAHFYDLACWLAGSDPVEISALGTCLIDPDFAKYDDVDTAILTLRLESGALVGFDFGRRTAFGIDELIEVFGSDGLLLADRQPIPGVVHRSGDQLSMPGLHRSWRERFGPTYEQELERFAAAIRGENAPVATLRDGLRAQAIAEAAVLSLTERQVIPIDTVWR